MASAGSPRLSLSGVSFLNAQPVLHGLLCGMGHERLKLQLAEPAELARQLFEGEVDAALAPVAPLATHGDLSVVPGVAIGCDGPVRSVLLVAEQPFETLDEVLLDAASRTSVVLGRLILRDLRSGDEPRYCARSAPDIVDGVSGTTGGLLIGDPALEAEGRFPYVIDLGEAWKKLTGLPFVFAVWIARKGVLTAEDCDLLRASLQAGLDGRAQIASAWQRGRGGEAAEHERYLTESIRYALDDRAVQGLREFFRRAAEAGLLPECDVTFVQDQATVTSVPAQRIETLLGRAQAGERLSLSEAQRVYEEAALSEIAAAAATREATLAATRPAHKKIAHLTYSNACDRGCAYCRVAVPVGDPAERLRTREELVREIRALVDKGVERVVLDGGIHPRLHLEWFENLFASTSDIPGVEVYALSPDELLALCARDDLRPAAAIERLAKAGVSGVYGSGAEVLTDRVRRVIAPLKADSRSWLDVMRLGHRSGLGSIATMMYGTADDGLDRLLHLFKLRDLQDETQGIETFVLWPALTGHVLDEDALLRLVALARLVLDNVASVQVPSALPEPVLRRALEAGASADFGTAFGPLLRQRELAPPAHWRAMAAPR